MRPVSVVPALILISVLLLSDCASERLAPSAPQGIDLSGEWNFDPNLSDDPSKLGSGDTEQAPQRTRGGHRGRGGGRGGGGMTPMGGAGGGYNYLPVTLTSQDTSAPQATQPLPETTPAAQSPPAGPPPHSRSGSGGHSLRTPSRLSITQKDGTVSIRASMTDGTQLVEDYKAGTSTIIPDGADSTAKRTVGWRGPVFVISTDASKGGSREDDFALDEEGHLIMTTQAKVSHRGTVEIKRVYDRVRGAAG